MTSMIQIGFDNPYRLQEEEYYFQYRNFEFKLVQTEAGRWSDVILTLTPDHDEDVVGEVYNVAGEFVTALSWEFDVGMAVRPLGILTVGEEFDLEQAEPNTFVFPRLPHRGNQVGYRIDRIGRITNDEQKFAMTLYREALGSNKIPFSILMFWQILETRGETAVQWVNELMTDLPPGLRDLPRLIEHADTQGQRLGNYLLEDCRHAIAHVNREPGRRQLQFDDHEEDHRLDASNAILRRLARHYIEDELGVTERLELRTRPTTRHPVYVRPDEVY